MKCVFITGAAGFIGSYVTGEFVKQGWHVFALVHRTKSQDLEAMAADGSVTIVSGDVTDYEGMQSGLRQQSTEREIELDVIVHCAGRASDVGWRREFRKANFESVQHMVRLVKELDVGRLVFVSTTDVYGLRDFNGETEEELDFAKKPSNPYPEFKIAAEKWIRRELPAERFSIVRPGQVWGVGDQTLTPRIVDFLRRSPWIVHFGKWQGKNRWALAHVQNVAAAIYVAATLPDAAGEAVNVLDNENTTMDEFCRILADIFLPGKRLRSVALPMWIGEALGRTVSGVSNALNLDRPFTDPSAYALKAATSNVDLGNRKLRDLLGKTERSMVSRDQGVEQLRNAIERECTQPR